MNRTKDRSTKHRNNTGAAQQVPFLLNDVVSGVTHTHSGISHTPTLPFHTNFIIAVCVRLLQISDAGAMQEY